MANINMYKISKTGKKLTNVATSPEDYQEAIKNGWKEESTQPKQDIGAFNE